MANDIRFVFKLGDGVRLSPVTGYWCTPQATGIKLDLFYEHAPATISVTHAIGDNGVLGPEKAREVSKELVREIMASVLITPQVALSLGQYLVEVASQHGAHDGPVGTKPTPK